MTVVRAAGATSAARRGSDQASRAGVRLRRLRWLPLTLLAAAPALAGLVALVAHIGHPYVSYGDQAAIALHARDVGVHTVDLGPYSRFGWYHPGPALYYVLAVPYRLLGMADQALAAGALVINGACLVAVAFRLRRRHGTAVAVAALAVIDLSLHFLEAGFLRDTWNPELPLLPLLLLVVLCADVVQGSTWSLLPAVLIGSFAVQSHVGYALPVTASLLVAVGVTVPRLIRGSPRRARARWAGSTAALALLVTWLPPLIQQFSQPRGNLSAVLTSLQQTRSTVPIADAFRAVGDDLATLPVLAFRAVGVSHSNTLTLIPLRLPIAGAAAALACGVFAALVAVRQRRTPALWLAGLTLVVAATGVAVISSVSGLPFRYVTQWTAVIGMLWWTTVIAALLPAARERWGDRLSVRLRVRGSLRPVAGAAAAVLALPALLLTVSTARAQAPQTDVTGQLQRLTQAILHDLRPPERRGDVPVRVDFAGTTHPVIVGTSWPGSGIVAQLVRRGVDVRVIPFWRAVFPPRYSRGANEVAYVATLAYADGSSPPPLPEQRLLARAGEYQVYGGPTRRR